MDGSQTQWDQQTVVSAGSSHDIGVTRHINRLPVAVGGCSCNRSRLEGGLGLVLCCSPQEEALSNTATLQDGWRCGSRLGVAHGPGGRLFLHRLGACVAGNKDTIIMSCLVQHVPATHRHMLQAVRKRRSSVSTSCASRPAGTHLLAGCCHGLLVGGQGASGAIWDHPAPLALVGLHVSCCQQLLKTAV